MSSLAPLRRSETADGFSRRFWSRRLVVARRAGDEGARREGGDR